MDDPLTIYLHDHLAGSGFAIELLENLASEFQNSESGAIANEILTGVRADRSVLEQLISRVGTNKIDLYDALGWIAEKVSRIKLQADQPEDLGVFEAFEAIGLGILGKRGLWETLELWRQSDERAAGFDYPELMARADLQFQKVNQYRLKVARTALKPAGERCQRH